MKTERKTEPKLILFQLNTK